MASVPLMLFATASAALLERSSTGRMTTWLRTPMRPFSRLKPQKLALLRSIALPPLGFEVLHVGVLAARDRRHDLADVDAVLDHGVARLVVLERDLVADRDIAFRRDLDFLVVFHDPAHQLLALLHAFDDDHPDAITFLVHDEMNHSLLR